MEHSPCWVQNDVCRKTLHPVVANDLRKPLPIDFHRDVIGRDSQRDVRTRINLAVQTHARAAPVRVEVQQHQPLLLLGDLLSLSDIAHPRDGSVERGGMQRQDQQAKDDRELYSAH